jgi:hypothetical protein
VGPRTGLDTEVRRKILSPLPGIEHNHEAQDLLGCTAVFLTECRPTFQRYISEDSELHTRRRENLKANIIILSSIPQPGTIDTD